MEPVCKAIYYRPRKKWIEWSWYNVLTSLFSSAAVCTVSMTENEVKNKTNCRSQSN